MSTRAVVDANEAEPLPKTPAWLTETWAFAIFFAIGAIGFCMGVMA